MTLSEDLVILESKLNALEAERGKIESALDWANSLGNLLPF